MARKSFQIALNDVLTEQQKAESLYKDVLRLHGVKQRIQRLMIEVRNLESMLDSENNQLNQVQNELLDNQRRQDSKQKQLEYLEKIRFGFFGVLLRWKEFLRVRKQKNELYVQCVALEENKNHLEERVKSLLEKTKGLRSKIEIYKAKIEKRQSKLDAIQQMFSDEKTENNRVIMDDEFWEQTLSYIQKSSPWITLKYTQARSRLFLEALRLHESFIMAAQSKIIGSLYAITKPSSIDYHADKYLFPGLWDVFTLIVPVVSSTFASFAGMFKGMESQSLGWLFIDEAGQAVPQAAIGAIWRSQRTVVVGDPLQIEPVVTLPKIVLQDVANYYEVSDRFISLNSSVQIVADMANKNGTWIRDKWIGSPLWVHRRCISPMFDICNEIAYDGRMVLDTSSPNPDIIINIDRLGPNAWIQVDGECTVKQFVPEQARVILSLIWKAFESIRLGLSNELPSLYIISPFAVVKQQLKTKVREAHRQIAGTLSKKEFNRWVNQSIGTVHTFQGKQADAVIFCLGVDGKNAGAAGCATSSVNLVNVAVSRAKYRFIVVGNKKIWSTKEYMSNVNRYLGEQSGK
ncbi:DEAD/DEAH box helicase [Paenibacillus radicis (ex Xue et al. 2023)]|uniref:DNA2/NAM7 family helicase n=1 Tax=Paenibacillus radicis (ex Xue et al. 2023) TaxID=2972489 RepID=A0ABT1YEA6_9BACL|nr:DEAD/DEAH box helicase [Paenibacillus radicis (ex Xue et al. 2023)]MCR8631525.1 DNA2/NAM7 family helicase [Paenibacillus radicis (ex Xue et al. 2023)]